MQFKRDKPKMDQNQNVNCCVFKEAERDNDFQTYAGHLLVF